MMWLREAKFYTEKLSSRFLLLVRRVTGDSYMSQQPGLGLGLQLHAVFVKCTLSTDDDTHMARGKVP